MNRPTITFQIIESRDGHTDEDYGSHTLVEHHGRSFSHTTELGTEELVDLYWTVRDKLASLGFDAAYLNELEK